MALKDCTELVFILDKSGSMGGLESDTIGGFNALLAKQKKEPGDVKVTTVLFNHDYELLHDRLPITGISPMTEEEYEVGGTTALLDAIGSTINKIGNVQKRTSEDQRADKVMFVITTDGMENASCEYNYKKIKSMISHQKELYNWEFLFMGANIDAVKTAGDFGIAEDFAVNYHADEAGTQLNYKVMSETISSFRRGKQVDRTWKKDIEVDFDKRSQE
ncbi:vWA domain-containing protein [Planococcus shenhongbingii]|uniref:VWA domain-containing protein n=1 Tax=Planococcus shenhongbingii TaxID=3058398 RepID=A0ABT8NGJ2_9BACL|nr:vWA domain-containing protein [Planococcus sp. N017]MDN7247017.1 VWA domain-containing protein [Planococcus sp. N017]